MFFIGYFIIYKRETTIESRNITALVQIDGKVFVEDIWDVKDINYSTLYQSYEGLNKEDFSDVRVSYFDENIQSWKIYERK